uniref:VWFA domain-containing protein n=1 Tax=Acrobeloides nanus TaxID=290746 RepID=A0A914CZJ2_9BILA
MLSSTNIQALGNFVVNQFVPAFPISLFNTKIAVEVFGTYSVTNSVYFDNYEDICNYIHAQMENSDQLGMTDVLLADVLRKYYDDLLSEGRAGYPQNLVLFTAISQPSIINNSLEIANQIKAAGVSINVIGINQPANSPLAQIATNYYSVPNFNPYNIVINWASNNICAGNSSVNSTEDISSDGTTPSQEETASMMIFAPIMYPFGNLHSGKNTTGNNSTSGSQSSINVTTEISATTMKLDMTSRDGASTHLGAINQSTTSGQVSQTTSGPEDNAGESSQNETDSSTIVTTENSTTVDLPITTNGDVGSGDNETNSSNGTVDSTTLVSATTNSSNIDSETNTSTIVGNFPTENSGNNSNQVGQNGTNLSSGIKSINELIKVSTKVDPPKTTEESETSTDGSTTSVPKSDSSKKSGPSQKNQNGSGASHNSKDSGYSATTLDPPASTTKDPPKSSPKTASKDSTKTHIAPLKGASKPVPSGTTSDPGTTQIPIVPETNREGTPCTMNSQNAWIDIVIVVEVSNAMTETSLNGLGASIADLVLFFNLNQSQIHSSRFALVTFNSNAVVQFDYTKYTDQQSLIRAFMGLSRFMTTDPIADMAR